VKTVETGKNPDILDQAAAVTDFLTEHAVDAQRALAAPEQHPRFDGKHCVEDDCGIELPSARLALGRVRCVDCQGRLEANLKQRGKRL
jgi:hypothetical protein